MRRLLPTVSALLLLLVGFAAGCDQTQQAHSPIGPDLAPLFDQGESGGDGDDGELATEHGHTGSIKRAAWIGRRGGSLSLAGHKLIVPSGAVSTSMCFTMETVAGSVVDVDLNAWQMEDRDDCEVEEDGDEEGEGDEWKGTLWKGEFSVPVTLSLTYARVTNVVDPSRIVVAWLKSATEVLPLSSSVDERTKTVRSELDHFSEYALFIP